MVVANRTRRLSVRNISIVVLVLVVIYALLGFLALPWWLERALPQRLEQHMGWQAEVGDVRVNPFVMSIEIVDLDADDSNGEAVLAFDRLYTNLGVWRLVTGVVALQNIELEEPYIRLDLLDDYSVNFAEDWQANNAAAEAPAEDEGASEEPTRLQFDRVRISGGELLFRDFSQQEQENFRVTPLDLALNDLATWPREESDSNYYLLAAVGSQTIEWEGDLSIAPLYSRGFIKLGGVTHTTLQHFLKSYLPYRLRDGRVTLSTDYELRADDELSLTTSGGQLSVENLGLGLADGDDELLTTDSIRVDDIRFGLNSREASTGTVTIDAVNLSLRRDPDGSINLLAPFQAGSDDTGEEQADDSAGSDMPFRWSVAGVELGNSSVNWRDQQLRTEAELSLTDLNIKIGKLSHQLEDPVNYNADATLGGGGRLVFNGQTTPSPFTLEAGIAGSDIVVAQFAAYINEAANLDVRDGRLNVDGNLDLDQQQDPLTGTFSGTGEVSELDVRLGDSDQRLIGWQTLRLEPVEYNVAPARLEIGTITLAGPTVNVVREQDGGNNLQRIVRSTPAEDSARDSAADDGEPEFIFRIGQLMLEEGTVSFTDRTLDPTFATRFDQLRGSVTGLSNVAPQQGKVSVQGRVGDVGSMTLDGSVGALGTDDTSEFKLSMESVSLPILSPYFGRYLGYGVDSGKLNLDLDYKFSGTTIDAGNSVVLNRLELGQSVPSDQAISAPVKLGLALLRDSDGVIDIDIPISGDLESPDFSIGQVVMNAFVNLVAKAATSPFSMLGSIVDMAGLSGEDLGRISFEPGRVEPAEGETAKLEALGKALNDRPSLVLNIRGAVSPEADASGLRRQRLFERVGIAGNTPPAERIARLEQAYSNSDNLASLDAFREEVSGEDGEMGQSEWEQALVDRLMTDIELPPEALGNLASARGVWLRRQMLENYEVPESQLFLRDPVRDASASEDGKVTISFELDAR